MIKPSANLGLKHYKKTNDFIIKTVIIEKKIEVGFLVHRSNYGVVKSAIYMITIFF